MFSTDRPATLVQYSSVFPDVRLDDHVRSIEVKTQPHAQYPIAALIEFKKPRARRTRAIWINPDNATFAQIEQDGTVVYDTRQDVPCDMAEWTATAERRRKVIAAQTARTVDSLNARTAAYLASDGASA